MAETSYEYITNAPCALISTSEPKIIRHMLRLADERPVDVDIRFMPENNDGVLVAGCREHGSRSPLLRGS